MTKIKISLLTMAIMLLTVVQTFAQFVTVLTNDGSTSGNGRAPSVRFSHIRAVYLITAAEMAAAGYANGTPVNGIGWIYQAAGSAGIAPLSVYLQNTADVLNNKSTTWATAITGMTQVHNNATTTLPASTAANVTFSGGSPFTYSGGGVYVAYDWGCFGGPLQAIVTMCNTTSNNTVTIKSAQQQVACPGTPSATMGLASIFRPATLFLQPQPANDLGITNVYSQGNLPVGYVTNHVVSARISNVGANATAATTANLDITGANIFSTSVAVPALASGASTIVSFPAYTPTVIGANSLSVTLPADDVAGNNTSTMAQTTSKDINSYRYIAPVTGGVGFTGATGDFIAKFTAANNFGNSDTINGFEVIFTTTGQPYNVGIWDATGPGGTPGTNIYTTPSQTTIADTVFISLPDVEVSGSYYVGLRQTGTVNVGFGFQTENLVRAGQFYFTSPTGNTAWTDFNAGPSNFRLTATVQYKTPIPPNCALYLAPANGSTSCQNGTTLTYGSGGGGPTGYRVYLGTNLALVQAEDNSTLVQNGAATTYNTGALLSATTYHWRVTAYNAQGDASGCVVLSRSFTTNLNSCYCVPTYADGTGFGDFISQVDIPTTTLNNPTVGAPAPYYTVFPQAGATTGSLKINQQYTMNVAGGTFIDCFIRGWIDYNQDGVFSASETIGISGNVGGPTPGTIVFTTPISALPGTTLMRLRSSDTGPGPGTGDACGATNSSFGETEDYFVTITCGATASASTPACEGGNLTLTATYLGAGTPVSYSWTTTAPSGYTNGTANPTITGIASGVDNGDYTVVITDNNGCTSSATVSVATISPVPVPFVNTPQSVCSGLPLGLTANNSAGGQTSTFDWTTTAANGFTATNTQSPAITASASAAQDAGTYTVLITNQFLCTASANIVVSVDPSPSLGGSVVSNVSCWGFSNICDGAVLAVASSGTAPYTYDDGSNFNADGDFSLGQPLGAIAVCFGAFSVTVTDDVGCTATQTYNVGAISTTPPTASVVVPPINNLPSFACSGTLVNNINVPIVGGGTTKYIWDGPAGTTLSGSNPYTNTTPTADITFGSLPGSASGYLIGVQAANGCGASLRKVQWVRGILSSPTVSGPTVLCGGGSGLYSITNVPAMVGAQNYTWTGPAGSTIDGNPSPYTTTSTSVTLVVPGGFTSGTMCVTANAACISTPPKCISISTAPAVLGVLSGNFTVCPPSPAEVYNVSNPGVVGGTYNWILPANTTGSLSTLTPTNTLNILAGFTGGDIKVSYTNTCGVTSALRSKTISIGLPTVPASITTTTTNGLCGQFATFNCPPQAGATFNWTFPASSTPPTASPSNTAGSTMPGAPFTSGAVCVTATNGCGTSSARCITVKGSPLTPGVTTTNPVSWCAPTAGVQFIGNVSALTGVYSLTWAVVPASAASYVSGQGTSNYTADWNTVGAASVNLTASNACGTTTRTLSVNIGSCLRVGEVTPTESSTDYSLMVNPNPATSLINFEFVASASNTTEINLMDISGRTVMTTVVNATEGFNSGKIDVSHLAKGIYSLQAKSVDGTSVVKVVVE